MFARFSQALGKVATNVAKSSPNSLVVPQRGMAGGHHRPMDKTERALHTMFNFKTLGSAVGLITAGLISTRYWQIWQVKHSDAFQTAMKAIQENPEVGELLGNPILDSNWLTSSQNGGLRAYSFRVYGSKASAWAYVSYSLQRNASYIDTIMVEAPVPGGEGHIVKPIIVVGKNTPKKEEH